MLIPGELIPIMGIGVALVAVTGRVIVQPIVNALLRYAEQQKGPQLTDTSQLERRLAAVEDRLASMESSMDRVLADRDFYLQLQAGKSAPPPDRTG